MGDRLARRRGRARSPDAVAGGPGFPAITTGMEMIDRRRRSRSGRRSGSEDFKERETATKELTARAFARCPRSGGRRGYRSRRRRSPAGEISPVRGPRSSVPANGLAGDSRDSSDEVVWKRWAAGAKSPDAHRDHRRPCRRRRKAELTEVGRLPAAGDRQSRRRRNSVGCSHLPTFLPGHRSVARRVGSSPFSRGDRHAERVCRRGNDRGRDAGDAAPSSGGAREGSRSRTNARSASMNSRACSGCHRSRHSRGEPGPPPANPTRSFSAEYHDRRNVPAAPCPVWRGGRPSGGR